MKKLGICILLGICAFGVVVGFTNKVYFVEENKGKMLLVDENGDSQYYKDATLKKGEWVVGKGYRFRFTNMQEEVYAIKEMAK